MEVMAKHPTKNPAFIPTLMDLFDHKPPFALVYPQTYSLASNALSKLGAQDGSFLDFFQRHFEWSPGLEENPGLRESVREDMVFGFLTSGNYNRRAIKYVNNSIGNHKTGFLTLQRASSLVSQFVEVELEFLNVLEKLPASEHGYYVATAYQGLYVSEKGLSNAALPQARKAFKKSSDSINKRYLLSVMSRRMDDPGTKEFILGIISNNKMPSEVREFAQEIVRQNGAVAFLR